MLRLKLPFIALAGIPLAHSIPLQVQEQQANVIEFVQKAVVRALDYSQGDRQSLMDAQDDFTVEGWREFMKRMEGWLDSNGAPLGSSNFTPNGNPVITNQENGVIYLSVSGTLKQSQNQSSTTYRVVVEVRVIRNPVKIAHLEPVVKLSNTWDKVGTQDVAAQELALLTRDLELPVARHGAY